MANDSGPPVSILEGGYRLVVNSDGSINVVVTSGGGGTTDVNLTKVGGTAIAIGQAAMAASLPVVIASDQSAVPVSAASLPLPSGAATLAEQQSQTSVLGATNGAAVITDANGTIQQYLRGLVKLAITVGGWLVTASGDVAHDTADSGKPVKVGAKGISYGTNPTGVTANDRTDLYANLAGIPFMLGGHPNVITLRYNATAAETNTKLITVSGGTKIVMLACTVAADHANTVDVAVRLGFAATNTPTTTGVYLSHPGVAPGSGIREAGMVAGADGDDFILTSEVPTTGSIDVVMKYFTIEA